MEHHRYDARDYAINKECVPEFIAPPLWPVPEDSWDDQENHI